MNNEQLSTNKEKLTRSRGKKKKSLYIFIVLCFLSSVLCFSCQDTIEPPVNGEMAVFRVYVGESSPAARTLQPVRENIAGYQLTFSGAVARPPVNITEGNSAVVVLPNGQWVITATAYRLGGTIGNEDDAIASGSITINISGGAVLGSVPPIILTQSGSTGNGILNYRVTVSSGVSGFLRLFDVDGNPVTSFSENGELTISASVDAEYSLAAGRYIVEVRLTNEAGHIAFNRIVIEIWESTTTTFIFEPTVFIDPNMTLPSMIYGAFSVAAIEFSGISHSNNILTITADGTYIISMRDGITSTTNHIVVADGVTADITLSSVNIYVSVSASASAFNMTGATVNLTLVGENVLRSGGNRSGLEAPYGSVLEITEASTGTLAVTGGGNGAGIGSDRRGAGGIISISGGTVTATGGSSGAGIGGGGSGGAGGIISISGGTVTATGLGWGPGIGNVAEGAGGNISISGGTVTATGGQWGAGIGSGRQGAGGNISISGGMVTATGGSNGAGIGGGDDSGGADISISGGTVTATGGQRGAGIGGGGSGGAGGNISISGGTVTATGGSSGAGIGGGSGGPGGTIEAISGNAVIFASSIQAELPNIETLGPAIVFNGINGIMYGDVTLARDITIPSDKILEIQNDQTLTIHSDFMLTNNGTIIVLYGGNIIGTIAGNQPILPLTGTVSITGTAEVRQTLTANITELGGSGTITYQWRRGTTNIGTNSSTYVVQPADAGSTITVIVTRADNSGSVTSNPTATIATRPPLPVEMVWVPGGSFELGREIGTAGIGDVTPVSTVTLSGFHMGKFPVTQEQYEAVMGVNPSWFTTANGDPPAAGETDAWRPVEQVSWYDAIVFCNRLSMMRGLTPAYEMPNTWPNPTSWSTDPDTWGDVPTHQWDNRWNNVRIVTGSTGYRLPTEAQWEYAAKGGNNPPVGFTFSGSNVADEVAWHRWNSNTGTREVGRLAPNGLGLYDMSGNVWEWVWDWWSDYTSEPKTDPTGAVSGTNRVVRGGSWYFNAWYARSVQRAADNPSSRWHDGGFRLVRP